MIKKILESNLLKFIIVGVLNTFVGMMTMLIFYNVFYLGYWVSSSISYVLGSTMSFLLNKVFTFNNKSSVLKTAIKFSINVIVCYVVSYGAAKPLVIWFLHILSFNISLKIYEQIAMILGMCIFTATNYIGQRFFVFRN